MPLSTEHYRPARLAAQDAGLTWTQVRILATQKRIAAFKGGSDWFVCPTSLREYLDRD